ncbi:Diguanylate cyclase DosC [Marinomonas spartinae]|uniref:GGDEF domain-containing protein n=1 Tax=Marinomonas spartinae TaxID=1792290 RepID=UPI000808BBBB|nr:GGDEF domain-containing protein [Marinomonas spartinae]SBS40375.1 Diguanylate cyclase DosC [Marinomonas spartinae]
MTESAQDKLIGALRKAISRISLLAEGNDPEVDSVIRQIRQNITKGADADKIQAMLSAAEPHLLNSEETHLNRAKQVRETLHDLIDLLEVNHKKRLPSSEKKALESLIRLHWQSPPSWPSLFSSYLALAKTTLSLETTEESSKQSLIKRLFHRTKKQQDTQNSQEIMAQISHTLSSLLTNLSLSHEYDEQIIALREVLANSNDLQQLPDLLDEVINLIIISTGKTQEGLTNYLNELNQQLASMNTSIVSHYKSQKTLIENRDGLNVKLEKQVSDTNLATQSATDLNELKELIDTRMKAMTTTMVDYKQQMMLLEKETHQSIISLKSKVDQMEKEASSMRTKLQEKLAQAMTDALTNLPNRAAYQDSILPLVQSSKKSGKKLFLAVCDIDHFKQVNDTWGHQAGDKVLRLVTRQLLNSLSNKDMIFRYGGEEFVALFVNSNEQEAIHKAETIRAAVESAPFNVNGAPITITISIGMACHRVTEDHDSLFERADKQLYIAKQAGRNIVKVDQTKE